MKVTLAQERGRPLGSVPSNRRTATTRPCQQNSVRMMRCMARSRRVSVRTNSSNVRISMVQPP